MKTNCPKCKGVGSVVVDYKECDACGGTGYEEDLFDVGSHFKGVNSKAKAKYPFVPRILYRASRRHLGRWLQGRNP